MEQDQGSGAQTLAQYRYNAGNLRAEKFLSNAGLNKATQGSAATYSPLAYERIQWDGLHARRSFEIRGTDNTQTLHSDTDAAVLAGNTAPWLFNRTQYANGLGSTSSTTQLHADSNGNLVATVASEGGTAKADSLLLYGAYGSVDSEASGNAGVGLKSNGHSFGSYYADPETGLLYARARYYDPASGQFISRDPVEGEARLPLTWGAYQYGRYNPYRYTDPNGECDSWRDCGTKIAGGLVGGIGLTAVKAVEGTLDTARFIGDGYLGLFGSEAAQRRNSERLDLINGVIDNAGQLPSAVRQAIANIDEKAQTEDANGNTFTAAMLRGNYAGEIGLAIAGLPQAARSAASLADKGLAGAGNAAAKERVAARALARELQAAEPVLAAKAPTAAAPQVRPHVGETTPKLLAETDGLVVGRETQSAVNTAQVGGSEATSARGFADYLSNSSAPEVRRELISITADLRASLPSEFQEVGNLAVAKVNVEGFSGNMKSFSRFADGEFGYTRLPDGPTILEPIKIGKGGIVGGKDAYLRNVDGEFKILENFSRSLGEDYSTMGRVDLFTELRACTSCSGAIMQFRQRYPGIQLNVFTGK